MLNMEEQQVHFVTLMAQDDYSPPGISYFNLAVTLTDVNDKPESVTMEPDSIPEEVEPGQYVAPKKYTQVNGFDVFLVLISWVNFSKKNCAYCRTEQPLFQFFHFFLKRRNDNLILSYYLYPNIPSGYVICNKSMVITL